MFLVSFSPHGERLAVNDSAVVRHGECSMTSGRQFTQKPPLDLLKAKLLPKQLPMTTRWNYRENDAN